MPRWCARITPSPLAESARAVVPLLCHSRFALNNTSLRLSIPLRRFLHTFQPPVLSAAVCGLRYWSDAQDGPIVEQARVFALRGFVSLRCCLVDARMKASPWWRWWTFGIAGGKVSELASLLVVCPPPGGPA